MNSTLAPAPTPALPAIGGTVADLVVARAALHPEALAVAGSHRLTYRDLVARAGELGGWLREPACSGRETTLRAEDCCLQQPPAGDRGIAGHCGPGQVGAGASGRA